MSNGNNKSIEELQKELNELISSRNDLIKLLEFFPLIRLKRLINLLTKLYNVLGRLPMKVWDVLFEFVRCNNKKLEELTVDELKKLVEALKAIADLELEAAKDETTKKALQKWLEKLDETLKVLSTLTEKDKAIAIKAIIALKQFLKDHYPKILAALLIYFGDDIKKAAKNAFKKALPGIIIKTIIKRIAYKILVKRLGKEMAKRLMPLVGLALTLAEFVAILGILNRIDNFQKLIDQLLIAILKKLISKERLGWPTKSKYVWFKDPDLRGATITITAYVHCFRIVDEEWLSDKNPCKLEFSVGKVIRIKLDDSSKGNYKKDKKLWEIPFTIDQDSLKKAPCVKGAKLCYIYLEIITTKGGKTMTRYLVIGAKEF